MNTYRIYRQARDAAWRALLRLEDKKLPVDAEALAESVGVQVHPWPDEKEMPELKRLADAVGGVCASLRIDGVWHVFLRLEDLDDREKRFAVAHELGHLLLKHDSTLLAPGVRRFISEENTGDALEASWDTADYAADIFASRLLSPACVLRDAGADTPEKIADLCGMPPKASALRAERMEELIRRDAFFKNPLEKLVRQAFGPWLATLPRENACASARGKWNALGFRRFFRWAGVVFVLAALILFFLLGRRA